jgi:hypothetical protein
MQRMSTAAGEVFKQCVTRYLDGHGRRVKAGTPGARKVIEESTKWYGRVQDPATGKWRFVPLSKDKQSARKKLVDLETRLARGEAGLVDPYQDTKEGKVQDLLDDYVDGYLTQKGRSEKYRGQTRREVNAVVAGCGAERLADLTVARVDRFLAGLTCSARSKNGYRRSVIGLFNYLVKKDRLPGNLLLKTTRSEEKKGEQKRKRRALKAEELQTLLEAARSRPLREAMTVRRGARKGQLLARVSPEEKARLERVGRHRALLYLTAAMTGWRLKTLRQVKVGYLDLASAGPAASLPGTVMKSGRDFRQPLREDLADELKAWVAESGKGSGDYLFDVPKFSQTCRLLRKDLKRAGIPYQDEAGRYFDFHSFRKCTGSFLRQGKVDPSVSKRFLDHSDIRMTMEVYNDEALLDERTALEAMPRLTVR